MLRFRVQVWQQFGRESWCRSTRPLPNSYRRENTRPRAAASTRKSVHDVTSRSRRRAPSIARASCRRRDARPGRSSGVVRDARWLRAGASGARFVFAGRARWRRRDVHPPHRWGGHPPARHRDGRGDVLRLRPSPPHGRRAHAGRPRRRRGPVRARPDDPRDHGRPPEPLVQDVVQHPQASTDDIVYISSREASAGNGTGGIFRVGVWGWSSAGAGGAAGSEWTLRVDLVPGGRNNTAARGDGDDGRVRRVLRRRRLVRRVEPRGGTNRGRVSRSRHALRRLRRRTTPPPGQRAITLSPGRGAVLAALASVFATAERVELGNNPNLRVTSGSGNGAALLEALYLAAPSLTPPSRVWFARVRRRRRRRRDVFSIGVRGDPLRVGLPAPIQLGPSRTRA